jgi:Universal stress protein UspA and related nucleotide-binding proteins
MEHVYQTILVGIDGSEQSKEAFKKAVEIARRNQGRVVVTVVIEPQTSSGLGYAPLADNLVDLEEQEAKDMLQEAKDYAASVNFNLVEDIVSFGSAKVALAKDLQEKYQADLIIVGQSGLNAVERFITGSVASYIIREAKCDVLVVSTEKEAE